MFEPVLWCAIYNRARVKLVDLQVIHIYFLSDIINLYSFLAVQSSTSYDCCPPSLSDKKNDPSSIIRFFLYVYSNLSCVKLLSNRVKLSCFCLERFYFVVFCCKYCVTKMAV